MRLALYHAEYGYYRKSRDPFGRLGDYYTAEQMQPVFGLLVAARIRRLYEDLGRPREFTIVELGAGRGEMAEAFSEWRYIPVEVEDGSLPERFVGVVFSNEFFDAVPVDAAIFRGGSWRDLRVMWNGERFVWIEYAPVEGPAADYLAAHYPDRNEGEMAEIGLEALSWIDRIGRSLERGFVLSIDYGYTRRESVRFREGTLMSYRRHAALEDVLAEPGERDITAHVNFSALEDEGRRAGLEPVSLEPLSQALLAVGEEEIAGILRAGSGAEETRRRMQLKTLLFSMGDTFRVLLQRR